MLSAIEVINILYVHIKNIVVVTGIKKINGSVYKMQRPINSDKEDIVINSLPISGSQIQEGVLNVNIYVPDIKLMNSDKTASTFLPNTARMTELSRLAINDLSEFWSPDGDYVFELENTGIYPEDNNQHYINLRIRFYSPSI